MNYQNPKLRRMLAAEYVLGTLHGPARKRFQRLLRTDAAAVAETRYWEARLSELNQGIRPVTPRPLVWASIEYSTKAAANKVTPIKRPAAAAAPRSSLWRVWAVVSTAASVALGIGLWQQLQKPPQVVTETRTVRVEVPVKEPLPYVAVLQPAKSTASWKVSVYPDRGLIKVAAIGRYAVDENAHSLELWVIEKSGPKPLGLLPLT
ncbi:MAG: anti-sigma factor, partial [Stenotrophobium sp.]